MSSYRAAGEAEDVVLTDEVKYERFHDWHSGETVRCVCGNDSCAIDLCVVERDGSIIGREDLAGEYEMTGSRWRLFHWEDRYPLSSCTRSGITEGYPRSFNDRRRR